MAASVWACEETRQAYLARKRLRAKAEPAAEHTARTDAWRKANPEAAKAAARRANRRRAGIVGPADILEAHKSGPCEICKRHADTLHLDHDHNTGSVRGWLCGSCNRGIGLLGDNLEGVRAALSYLTKESQ